MQLPRITSNLPGSGCVSDRHGPVEHLAQARQSGKSPTLKLQYMGASYNQQAPPSMRFLSFGILEKADEASI